MKIEFYIEELVSSSHKRLYAVFNSPHLSGIEVVVSQSACIYPELIGCIHEEYNWGKEGYTVIQTGIYTIVIDSGSFEGPLMMYEINGEDFLKPTYINQLALMEIVYRCGNEALRIFQDDETVQMEYDKYRNYMIKSELYWAETTVNKRLNPNWVEAMNEELEKLSFKISSKINNSST